MFFKMRNENGSKAGGMLYANPFGPETHALHWFSIKSSPKALPPTDLNLVP